MTNYFDYLLEESIPQDEEPVYVYNEMDATMCEFDSYVQEGVGLKIAAGLGLAVLIGLLLTAIIKLVSSKSDKSASVAVAGAKYMSKLAKQYGVEQVVFDAKHKKGWMTDLNMRAFDVISSMTIVNTDTIREQIEYLENFDEKDVENVDVHGKLMEMWHNTDKKIKRMMAGNLKATGKTLDDFDIFRRFGKLVPEKMSGREGSNGDWGETGVKYISQIDDRLKELGEFIKGFKTTGKELQDLRKRAVALEKSKPTLMSRLEGVMDEKNCNVNRQLC